MAIGKIVAAPQVHRDGPAQRWKKIKDIVAPYPEADSKKFGFWFNYFWAEAVSIKEVTDANQGEQGAKMQRELAVLFGKVLSLDSPSSQPVALQNVDAKWTTEEKRTVLTQLLQMGFVAVPLQGTGAVQDASPLFVDQVEAPASRIIKVGYRCDTRPWSLVQQANGYRRRVDQAAEARKWGLDQPWHPFSQPEIKRHLWFRKGKSKDNCLQTVVSAAITFRDCARFPRMDDGPLFNLPRKSIAQYTTLEKSTAVQRAANSFTPLRFINATGVLPAHMESDSAVYVFKIENMMGYNTQARQKEMGVPNPYAERGVNEVPIENFLARIPITRVHLDNDQDFDVKSLRYQSPKYQLLPDENSVKAKLGGTDSTLQNFKLLLDRILTSNPYDSERVSRLDMAPRPVPKKLAFRGLPPKID